MGDGMRACWLPLVAGLLLSPVGRAADAGALNIDIRAREIAPGELVRVDVTAPSPVSRVAGTLRGETLSFVSACAEPGPCAGWSAWAALDLDWAPGPLTVVASATSEAGRVEAQRTLSLRAKSFPLQELKVEKKYVEPPKDAQARIARESALLAEMYARRTALAPPGRAWVRPVPGEPTGTFGARRVFNGQKRKPHAGLDLRAATGTPVVASGPGLITLARDLYFSGQTVIIDHGGGLFTLYAHLSRMDVDEGGRIAAGDAVGLSGATGRVTGPHLHWGGKVGDRIFDPTCLLDPAFSRSPGP